MHSVPQEILQHLFSDARTHNAWLAEEVPEQVLRHAYNLMKWGPTSANTCPARLLFIKSGPARDKLLPCLSPTNVEKVRGAPVTVVIAMDEQFYEKIPQLFPMAPQYRDVFAKNKEAADATAFRNSSLQGAYFILAARALGLGCGPMSGFDNKKLDEAFFSGTTWKSNFICTLGYADKSKVLPRLPRLEFEEACKIV